MISPCGLKKRMYRQYMFLYTVNIYTMKLFVCKKTSLFFIELQVTICMYVGRQVGMYVCMHVCMSVCVCICICKCICMCMCMYMYMYLFIHRCIRTSNHRRLRHASEDQLDHAQECKRKSTSIQCHQPWIAAVRSQFECTYCKVTVLSEHLVWLTKYTWGCYQPVNGNPDYSTIHAA